MSMTQVHSTSGESRYSVRLSSGDHQWLSDEPVSLGGANTGPTPTQLLLSSLAACTSITLKMYATRKGWPLIDVRVSVEYDSGSTGDDGSRTFRRQIELVGEFDVDQRARLLQIANSCPIHKLLVGKIQVSSHLVVVD